MLGLNPAFLFGSPSFQVIRRGAIHCALQRGSSPQAGAMNCAPTYLKCIDHKGPIPASTPPPLSRVGILSCRFGSDFGPVGAGVGMRRGGDACVALVLIPRAPSPSCQCDASVPTPPNCAPAPTDTIHPLPQIPTRVSGSGWDVEWGRLRRPVWRGKALVGRGRGRRKRPLPIPHLYRPYGTKGLPRRHDRKPTCVRTTRVARTFY